MSLNALQSLTGGGGLTGGNAGPAMTGPTSGTASTGSTTINIGGNPNARTYMPILVVGAVFLAVWAWRRSK